MRPFRCILDRMNTRPLAIPLLLLALVSLLAVGIRPTEASDPGARPGSRPAIIETPASPEVIVPPPVEIGALVSPIRLPIVLRNSMPAVRGTACDLDAVLGLGGIAQAYVDSGLVRGSYAPSEGYLAIRLDPELFEQSYTMVRVGIDLRTCKRQFRTGPPGPGGSESREVIDRLPWCNPRLTAFLSRIGAKTPGEGIVLCDVTW